MQHLRDTSVYKRMKEKKNPPEGRRKAVSPASETIECANKLLMTSRNNCDFFAFIYLFIIQASF